MTRNNLILGFILYFAFFFSQHSVAQTFGNEWIDFNQSYFKLKIAENGVYRISQADLNNAGFPATSIDPRRIQIFKNGQEQAIFIQGQSDGVFHSTDYIEFYAEANDGNTDTELYVSPSAQPHTLYSLFTDSSTYFITYKLSAENGKRMASFSENNVTGIVADEYYLEDSVIVLSSNYYEGRSYGGTNKILLPQYDVGEGFTGNAASTGQSLDFNFDGITNTFTTDIKPRIEVLLAGRNNNPHSVEILVGGNTSQLRTLTTASFSQDNNFLVSSEIEWSDISTAGNLTIQVQVNGINGSADRASVSYLRLVYPRQFDFSGKTKKQIQLKTSSSGKSFISAGNPPSDATLLDITDSNNPIMIGINESFQSFNAIVPNTDSNRKLWLQSSLMSSNNIKPTNFQNIDASLYNYLIVTNEALQTNTTDGQPNPVESYKNFRESTAGGGHSVIIQNIQDIFDQFNYGLPSPIAIRRYCDYMLNGGNPEFLFLIGRASDIGTNFYRQETGTATVDNLVPTYGFPGSDIAFTAGLAGTSIFGAIPTGRINATTPNHIQIYLDKVIETETEPVDNLRKKRLIHLSGGVTENELVTFKSYINGFKNVAEAPLLGGTVAQASKDSNEAVELINISGEINDGVILVTFFGHSTAGITDIEVGTVSDPSFGYANKGKYPVFLVNGCNAGDFFGANVSFGVDWILTPNLGALGFLAHSDIAFSGPLRNYTDLFYEVGFSDENFIGQELGKIIKETSSRYAQSSGLSVTSIGQVQLLNLQGDPAIKLFGADKPDFDIDDNTFQTGTFDGAPLLVDTETFFVDINIKNYGTVPKTPFNAIVKRTLNNGTVVDSEIYSFDPVLNSDTVRMIIDNKLSNNLGLNAFEIILDPFDEVEEINEQNNSLTFDLFFATGSTQNLYPVNFGVVTNPNMTFSFQSTDLLTGNRDFDFEIDTVSSFNSSYLTQRTVSANAIGQVELNINASNSIPDGTVFYWRTRFNKPKDEEDTNWIESSFTFDTNETASWAQNTPVQFKDFELKGMSLDTITGVWDFFSSSIGLELKTFGPAHPTFDHTDAVVLIDGLDFFNTSANPATFAQCRSNTINFVTFDNQSTAPKNPITFDRVFDLQNPLLCGKRPQLIYSYRADEYNNAAGPEALIDQIEQGDQVAVFSLGQVDYSLWTDAFKSKLEELGISRTTLDNLQNGEPVIFFGKKGSLANSAIEVVTTTIPKIQQEISLDIDVTGGVGVGTLQTQKIGPALSWASFENQIDFSSNPADDVKDITVIGIDKNNVESNVISNTQSDQIDLSSINAVNYPFIKLKVDLEDPINFTPPQLNNWKVFFEEAPEGILLNRNSHASSRVGSIQEGDTLRSDFTFWNISGVDFTNPVKVTFDALNTTSNQLSTDELDITPPASGDSTNFSLAISTLGKTGNNDLSVTANKDDQTEVYSGNNNLMLTNFFEVTGDQINPILEVSFDGVYILDGDIVSPNPNILIKLKDENEFILKSDTLGINIFLKSSCEECDHERISFSSPEVLWTNATEESDFSIEYRPQNLPNGIHSLRVQAQDASGNNSGLEPYEINFEIINESTVTNFYPYPNPFSTSTRFVFTLTGSVIPDDIKIQIMTVTGRVVKEIFRDELGSIRIGNNITDYAWDGRDQYGDQLANGVYLYRVIIQENGNDFDKRSASRKTSADEGFTDIDGRAFKNGFGKLYLLR